MDAKKGDKNFLTKYINMRNGVYSVHAFVLHANNIINPNNVHFNGKMERLSECRIKDMEACKFSTHYRTGNLSSLKKMYEVIVV